MATTATTATTSTTVTPPSAPPLAERLLDQAIASAKARAAPPPPAAAEVAGPSMPDVSATRDASIVVALDGSEFAHAALVPAMQMARCFGLPLAIVQAATPAHDPSPDGQLWQQPGETNAPQALHCAVAAARAQGLQVTEVLVTGALAAAPARAILAAAEEFHAKLIVLATHGRTGLSRVVHGSVAAEVVHGTDIPVLLVRP